MDRPFRFISLGGDCQPGYHSRRVMGYQDIPFVFDWLATPITAADRLLQTGFANFFATEHLRWETHDTHVTVIDGLHGVSSNHHFKFGPPDPIEQVNLTFSAYARRFMAMLESDMPVIFFRRWIEEDGDAREAAARQLHERLKVYRPDAVLLYLQPHEARAPVIDGNFISAFNPASRISASWEGYAAIYNRNFNRALRLASAATELV